MVILPLGKILPVEEHLRIRGCGSALAEGRSRRHDGRLGAVRIVEVPFAAGEHRRVSEAVNLAGLIIGSRHRLYEKRRN